MVCKNLQSAFLRHLSRKPSNALRIREFSSRSAIFTLHQVLWDAVKVRRSRSQLLFCKRRAKRECFSRLEEADRVTSVARGEQKMATCMTNLSGGMRHRFDQIFRKAHLVARTEHQRVPAIWRLMSNPAAPQKGITLASGRCEPAGTRNARSR